MSSLQTESQSVFAVVVNQEDQYSIWPTDQSPPAGWKLSGAEGSKEHCFALIKDEWIDMRPLSLRNTERMRVSDG